MKSRALIIAVVLGFMLFSWRGETRGVGQAETLPAPGFHHLHLNSVNPDATIAFYIKQFPSTASTTFAGSPALRAGNVLLLFTKVGSPPLTQPQTAIWHFGWHVVDVRKNLATYRQRKDVHLLPLFTSDEGGAVFISSDTFPGTGGVLGLTKAQLAEARAHGVKPLGGAGFAYLQGPDGAIVEYQGNMPAERFNHVHMYQEYPLCAQIWYEKHLNAAPSQAAAGRPLHSESDCEVERGERSWPALERAGTIRVPSGGVTFGTVDLNWYSRQGDVPLASSRGHVSDHIALSVRNLDAWIVKLRTEQVTFLRQPYKLGDMRAVMIQGPSREAIELVEVK